jgi:hypothetical protein
MKLMIERFGGIIPGTDPVNLPQNAAQTAQDVDLSEGTIKPWGVTNAFRRLHDDNGDMLPGFPSADIGDEIAQAGTITQDATNPYSFLAPSLWGGVAVTAKVFITYIDASGEYQEDVLTSVISEGAGGYRTTTGFVLYGSFGGTDASRSFEFSKGISYKIHGPKYQIQIANAEGFSIETIDVPTTLQVGSPQIPVFAIPIYTTLTKPDGTGRAKYQFGTLECVDVNGAQVSGNYEVPDSIEADTLTNIVISGNVDFIFECNYVRNTAQRVYYVQQIVDGSGRDGPESELSEEIQIRPGQYIKLNCPAPAGGATRYIYRSANSESGFAKVGEVTGTNTVFYDDLREALTTDLRPNGALPHAATVDETVAEVAVKGALRHPAGYFVYFLGADLRPSSEWIDIPRPWTAPEEYTYTFDSTIQCLALSGGTIIVFTANAVYRAHGQHPGRLAVYRISEKPILSKLTLWQDGMDIGWCDSEGLVVYDGQSGSLLTGDYMRADRWQGYGPSAFKVKVNDKAVCLFRDTGTQLRFDFRGDRTAAISTFTVTNGSATATWKSKVHLMPKPMAWYACRIEASAYPVTMKLYGDGALLATVSVTGDDEQLLPRMAKCWRWEIQIETANEVRTVAIASNRREL